MNDYLIEEARANLVRIQGELIADTVTYWKVSERLEGIYDGDTDAQYADMMRQFSALSAISSAHGCIDSITADIERYKAEDLEAHEAWFTAHYDAKQAMQARAETMGAMIIDDKNTTEHSEHYFIVLAKYRHDFVTWVWANGGFHNGHYYNDDAQAAQADFIKRTQ